MINRIFRLVGTKRIEIALREFEFSNDNLIIKPDYLSICAADMRYYLGKRKKEILSRKLPIALIHEGVGQVIYDPLSRFKAGNRVVLLPNQLGKESAVKGNYRRDSVFMSSNADGFMQDFLSMPFDRVIPLSPDIDYRISVFCELLSVAFNATEAFEKSAVTPKDSIGVWGDGSVGFAVGLVLKYLYPQSKIYIFGKNHRKLARFSFASKTFFIDNIDDNINVNHCFECTGGFGSESAISQIVDIISPQGCVCLLGVNDDPVLINTRTVLEKGLTLIGNSRSEYSDFQNAVNLVSDKNMCQYLKTILSQICTVRNVEDIYTAFESAQINDFKTVMEWKV